MSVAQVQAPAPVRRAPRRAPGRSRPAPAGAARPWRRRSSGAAAGTAPSADCSPERRPPLPCDGSQPIECILVDDQRSTAVGSKGETRNTASPTSRR